MIAHHILDSSEFNNISTIIAISKSAKAISKFHTIAILKFITILIIISIYHKLLVATLHLSSTAIMIHGPYSM